MAATRVTHRLPRSRVWLAGPGLAGTLFLPVPAAATELRAAAAIEVSRILVEVRVVERHGRPVPGIDRDDFEVAVGGVEVEVEAARWVDEAPAPAAATAGTPPPGPRRRPPRPKRRCRPAAASSSCSRPTSRRRA